MTIELKTGRWNLADISSIKKNGLKVFSCFSCAGGSTMGYKLAGYDVIGCLEIDPRLMNVYKSNHKPKYAYTMDIKDFNNISNSDLPEELFNIDILDGSPPCSSFSISGSREEKWGKNTFFAEGQKKQILDTLFFDFINTADKLKPKVIIAENVKGLIIGNAKGYVKEIFEKIRSIGYEPQLFLLNASKMGVPQMRERLFFIAKRKDINKQKISLHFDEKIITAGQAFSSLPPIDDVDIKYISKKHLKYWLKCCPGKCFSTVHEKKHLFNWHKLSKNRPSFTLAPSNIAYMFLWDKPRRITKNEAIVLQSFPDDFDFCGISWKFCIGMSVPPFMMQRIANQIKSQWFNQE